MLSDKERRDIIKGLASSGFKGDVKFHEPLSGHTTFKIGGPCNYFIIPYTIPDIRSAIKYVNEKKVPWAILGGGSNVLFPDHGFNGAIIEIGDNFAHYEEEADHLYVEAGMPLKRMLKYSMLDRLGGFEFLVGIPGTVGGAIAANAGTRDEWIDKLIQWVEAVDHDGDPIRIMKPKGGYRRGYFSEKGLIVIAAALAYTDTGRDEIRKRLTDLMQTRMKSQPYGLPSAGCVFKNPEGNTAWELIDSVGLRGHKIGGASFSEKHCNFIVCSPDASSADVVALLELAEQKVRDEKGVQLEREIVLLGFDLPVPEPLPPVITEGAGIAGEERKEGSV